MSEALRDRNASMPDCTLSGDPGPRRLWKLPFMWIEDDPQSLGKPCGFTHSSHSLDDYLANKKSGEMRRRGTHRLRHTNTKDTKCYTLKIR